MHFEQDFYSFTMLCYLKDNVQRYRLTEQKLSTQFYFLGIIFFVTNTMLGGMLSLLLDPDAHEFDITPAKTFTLQSVRFVCAVALHVMLYPEVKKGMQIMKYSNNHEHLFRESYMPFLIGFMQYSTAVLATLVNMYLLAYQKKIEKCIIYFVALEVVVELPRIYFESMHGDEKLFEVFNHKVKVTKKGKDIKMSDRTHFGKVARVIYLFLRLFYVSIVFYCIPFAVMIFNYYFATVYRS